MKKLMGYPSEREIKQVLTFTDKDGRGSQSNTNCYLLTNNQLIRGSVCNWNGHLPKQKAESSLNGNIFIHIGRELKTYKVTYFKPEQTYQIN